MSFDAAKIRSQVIGDLDPNDSTVDWIHYTKDIELEGYYLICERYGSIEKIPDCFEIGDVTFRIVKKTVDSWVVNIIFEVDFLDRMVVAELSSAYTCLFSYDLERVMEVIRQPSKRGLNGYL